MTEGTSETPFDKQCLDVLQAIGKTLSQMNLYKAEHPAVAAMIGETSGMLVRVLENTPKAEVVYSIDQNKLIANGRIIGALQQVPNSIPQIFNRFKLNSVGFRTGITPSELKALCELAALRPEAAKDVLASEFLKQRGVESVSLNEAVYAKVEKAPETETQAPPEIDAEQLALAFAEQPLERMLQTLVNALVKDPADRAKVLAAVLKRIGADLERAVTEATRELTEDKTVLQNEQSRTQAVMGTMADGVVTVGDSGEVLMMNPEAESLFGGRLSEMLGKALPELMRDDHMLALATDMDIPKDRNVEGSAAVRGSSDAQRTLRASTVVVKNQEGKPVGMVSAPSDQAKHREIDKMEREFVAHVTHELRSPLSSIRAALEMLNDEIGAKIEGPQIKMMRAAIDNTDRLDKLITGILDFSKIQAGQMTVYPKPCDAERIGRGAAESLYHWAKKRELTIDLKFAPGTKPVVADETRSVQVIINLLSNAIKFSPKGGRIELLVAPGAGQRAGFTQYSVKDSGPGIPKSEQQRVFEKFQQIVSGERHVGGTGLGLSIAKALAQMQKGELWLESEEGRGATFHFTLPEHLGAAPEAPAAKAEEPVEKPWWKRLLGI